MGAEPGGGPLGPKAPLWVDRWPREMFIQLSKHEDLETGSLVKTCESLFCTPPPGGGGGGGGGTGEGGGGVYPESYMHGGRNEEEFT